MLLLFWYLQRSLSPASQHLSCHFRKPQIPYWTPFPLSTTHPPHLLYLLQSHAPSRPPHSVSHHSIPSAPCPHAYFTTPRHTLLLCLLVEISSFPNLPSPTSFSIFGSGLSSCHVPDSTRPCFLVPLAKVLLPAGHVFQSYGFLE